MILFRLALSGFVLGVFLTPFAANAADSIPFTTKDNFNDRSVMAVFSQHDFSKIAAIDLNNDSIDEYVLSFDVTDASNKFSVFAVTDNGAVSLGTIKAQKLMLAYDEHNGVRSLLGFTDANNDYEYDIYAWDAAHSSYSKKQGGLQ